MKKILIITFLLILSLLMTSCLSVENVPKDESKESASAQIPTEVITG